MGLYEAGSFVLSGLQAVAAVFQIRDRFSEEGKMSSHKGRDWAIALLLVGGAVFATGLGVWVVDHPPKPIVVQAAPQIVEKTAPCPPSKTGPATAKSGQGGTSFAHSGSGDTLNSAPASKPK